MVKICIVDKIVVVAAYEIQNSFSFGVSGVLVKRKLTLVFLVY